MPQFSIAQTGINVAIANSYRKSISFQHIGTANFIFLDNGDEKGLTTSNASLRIGAGASVAFSIRDDGVEQVQDEWSAISDTGTNTLLVKETFIKEQLEKRLAGVVL